ncbi:penicillin-binding protein 1B [Ectothiorhodospira haloalkaliphila]|uniref:penicillin-binding protein 1B n=1 Tax=Ectothiorhodospira haloalkaliphila TaxID=421628 RepID=UPI001EE9A323|nr:penicillin-binding protein 1B [Ectothiorhodospira haloalkaliphila]MCG5525481.1 penicillin-binding protein 1B [Ectothiorhodospira haloalkaliphila]
MAKRTTRRAAPRKDSKDSSKEGKSTSRRRSGNRSSRSKRRSRRRSRLGIALAFTALLGLGALVGLGGYTLHLDQQIRSQFEGKRWSLPARVFARPLEIYVGLDLDRETLEQELQLLHYHPGQEGGGRYARRGDSLVLNTRGFPFADGYEPARSVRVSFSDGRVSGLEDLEQGNSLPLLRLEPALIANIYPSHGEDRLLVQLDDVPEELIRTLLTVEDRKFYEHRGVDPAGIARAALANLRAGRTVQGGSTLTQQLVKNYFLTHDRSWGRKFNEAIMALLLEWRYDKDEILEAYLNEVFLGQDGMRAIHGVGMASQFYFQRQLSELGTAEMALLVGIIRGPSFYDPRRRPERAMERRNLVLTLLESEGHLESDQASAARERPLNVSANPPSGVTPFPAFVQLLRDQLRRDYRDADLQEEGLLIFTTLDPIKQLATEQALVRRLARLEQDRGLPEGSLQGAVVVTRPDNGEVLAVVGDRQVRQAGFNRALQARRPVGSVIKPMVYLAALSHPQRYSLATLLEDEPFTVELDNGDTWTPRNASREFYGQVTAQESLVRSYNVATTRLGMDLGVGRVVEQIRRLGIRQDLPAYPSLLLGAVDMSPLEVTGLYQGLASGGYHVPLRAIREVMDREGQLLQRYSLSLRQAADEKAVYLVTAALHEVTRSGTGRRLQSSLPEGLAVAGKTGTTGEMRDAWFAGYSGDALAVVWVGRDDNQPMGLTGSSGALPVWSDVMQAVSRRGLMPSVPEGVAWRLIDAETGLLAEEGCETAQWMPFIDGSAPMQRSECGVQTPPQEASQPRWLFGGGQ